MSNHSHDTLQEQDETYLYENNQEQLYIGHSHGTKEIWKIFWWLGAITVVDILFYFTFDENMFRNIVFIGLGIIKAYLIIGYFMHMKQERTDLIMSIILPIIFILWGVGAILKEGASHMM